MTGPSVELCAIFRIPPDGIAAFRAYEDAVLPLLTDHGGTLRRRVRTSGGKTEIHLIRFPSPTAFAAYRSDPRRAAWAGLFAASGATAEILEVEDAGPGNGPA